MECLVSSTIYATVRPASGLKGCQAKIPASSSRGKQFGQQQTANSQLAEAHAIA